MTTQNYLAIICWLLFILIIKICHLMPIITTIAIIAGVVTLIILIVVGVIRICKKVGIAIDKIDHTLKNRYSENHQDS